MQARNVVSSAAIAAGHDLGTARAVGRNKAVLRRAMFDRDGWLSEALSPADCRTLACADLITGTPRRAKLTTTGRMLAVRL